MIYLYSLSCEDNYASQHEAGILCRERLFQELNISDSVYLDENSRPCIKAVNIDFSVSHSKNLAICAVICDKKIAVSEDISVIEAFGTHIGIDIEFVDITKEISRLIKLSDRYLGVAISSVDEFYNKWTRKEAFGKLCGHGVTAKESDKGCTYLSYKTAENQKVYQICICYK